MQLLEALGEFTPKHDDAIGFERVGQIAHGLDDAVWRLIDDHDRIAAGQGGEPLASRSRSGRQKSFKTKPRFGKTGDRQQRDHGAGARHRNHRQPGLMHRGHHARSGVADARCAGVAGQRHRLAGTDALDDGLRHPGFVMLMAGDQRRMRADVVKQHASDPRIFRSRGISPPKDIDGPQA